MKATKRTGLAILLAVASGSVFAQEIRVTVDGDPINFSGVEPITRNGRVFVPLRGVFESMGAFVDWDQATKTINAQRNQKDVRLTIGDRYALVDGKTMFMDEPPMVIQGRTMVPLRFLSESLGADVQWMSADHMVAITTGSTTYNNHSPNTGTKAVVMVDKTTVLPVALDQELSSNQSQKGDRFTATLQGQNDTYAGIPEGTKIQGKVVDVKAKSGDQPGMIELKFNKMILPDGRTANIKGSLIGLDDKSVEKNDEGIYTAKSTKKDQRVVFAGYGAGAGLLVGLLTKKPLEGALLGGVLGYLLGEVDRAQKKPADVHLKRGTEFGVRLDEPVTIGIE
ncbi:MAG: hypothetical protein BGO01_07400 [Armatimonadetes bacterium 55-13]|nr:copper amine oxidase N-terminal domain-containing protein [Armatimonadota bacterium]OJU63691.1 MAG: hypothetical protein BGO01_07400 [Armatimonadetes bacterium 55-13]